MFREQPQFYNDEVLEYGRKSRLDDPLLSVEEALEKHSKDIDDYARKYLGGPIPLENKFQEVASGESIDSRPEMLRLLKTIESPKIKAIIVVDVQRLSRGDLEDAGRLIKLLRFTNTCVITPMKTYDLRDEYDRDAFERELKRGSEYLQYFKKIQSRGKLASLREGNYVGSVAPFGYERLPISDGKRDCFTLVEKEDEANIVRLIFEWYCNEDIGVTVICRRLEKMGVRTKSGGTKWYTYVIFSMLENVHYIGYVRWNWRKTIQIVEDQEIREQRPKAKNIDEYLVFPGKHKGIVSEELFRKAAEIKGKRHRTKPDTTLQNPFSGLMFCKCGSKIGYNTYNKHGKEMAPPKLKCNNQVRCKTGSADFHEVFDYILHVLKDCKKDFEVRIDNKQDDSIKLHKSLIANLEKKLKELEAREKSQWAAQSHPDEDQRMPPHIFKELNQELLIEKAEVKKALCEAYESTPETVDYKDVVMKFTDAIEALQDPNISAKIKNQYLRDIISRIEYTRSPNIRITKQNAHLYATEATKGLRYRTEPFTIRIKLKY